MAVQRQMRMKRNARTVSPSLSLYRVVCQRMVVRNIMRHLSPHLANILHEYIHTPESVSGPRIDAVDDVNVVNVEGSPLSPERSADYLVFAPSSSLDSSSEG